MDHIFFIVFYFNRNTNVARNLIKNVEREDVNSSDVDGDSRNSYESSSIEIVYDTLDSIISSTIHPIY